MPNLEARYERAKDNLYETLRITGYPIDMDTPNRLLRALLGPDFRESTATNEQRYLGAVFLERLAAETQLACAERGARELIMDAERNKKVTLKGSSGDNVVVELKRPAKIA